MFRWSAYLPGHGVAGVDHQIHQYLLDLAWIGTHYAEIWCENLDKVDVLAEDPPKHLLDPSATGSSSAARTVALFAAEGQELSGQNSRAVTGLFHLKEIVLERVSLLERLRRKLSVA